MSSKQRGCHQKLVCMLSTACHHLIIWLYYDSEMWSQCQNRKTQRTLRWLEIGSVLRRKLTSQSDRSVCLQDTPHIAEASSAPSVSFPRLTPCWLESETHISSHILSEILLLTDSRPSVWHGIWTLPSSPNSSFPILTGFPANPSQFPSATHTRLFSTAVLECMPFSARL